MSLRLAKQIIYGVFYLLVWSGLIAGVYFLFLKPAPSCFDKIQNQDEAGVDCGGSCNKVCVPKEIREIELVGHVLTFPIDKNHSSLLAQIKNPNFAYAARNFKYTFSFYDTNGQIVKSFEGRSFIYASEIKYILVPNAELNIQGSLSRIDFAVRDIEWDSADNFRGPPIIVSQDFKTSIQGKNLFVEGRMTNNDTITFPDTTVIAIFSGNFGQTAGASETAVNNLSPNESRPFSILYPLLENINVSNTKIFIYAKRQ